VLWAADYTATTPAHGPTATSPTAAIVTSVVVFAVFCALHFVGLIDSDLIVELASILLELAAFLILPHTAKNLPRPFRAPGGWVGAVLIVLAPTAVDGRG
jgi:hypothetical protein